jgi:DNA helicase-2/ATP-dependent DNA helicase PcrA
VTRADTLNTAQEQAVLHTEGPLLIVAGAGAGKTRTITHRIAHLIESGVNPTSILAVTFTNKAAGEMRSRVDTLLGSSVGWPCITTFHGLGARLLREFAEQANVPRSFSIWDRDDSLKAVKRALTELGLENSYLPRNVLATMSRAKGEGVIQAAFAETARSQYQQSVARAWEAYDALRRREEAVDFSDLLLQTLLLLRSNPLILDTLRARWTHLTIDEYQDTNFAQYEIARLLAGNTKNICAVGDLDQCIYSWNGANIGNLLSFERSFPGTHVITLEQNYRSTKTILTAANAVIERNVRRVPKRLFTENNTGEAITLLVGETERDEAFLIARSVRELLGSGTAASEISVLFRENFQSRALEEACIALGLPYRVLGVRFFDRAEVKTALAYVKAALNPKNTGDFARAAGFPSRGIGKQTLEKLTRGEDAVLSGAARTKVASFRAMLARIKERLNAAKASDAIRSVIAESGMEKTLREDVEEGADRIGNLHELVAHATRYDTLPPPDGIERLLEDAALMSDQDTLTKKQDAVSLMTVHASKGLEFDAIFVTGLEQGLFPSQHADDERDPEEERRLFYVALTRARHDLYLTYALSRFRYGKREFAMRSEFIDDIDPRLIREATHDYSRRPREGRHHLLDARDTYDDEDIIT